MKVHLETSPKHEILIVVTHVGQVIVHPDHMSATLSRIELVVTRVCSTRTYCNALSRYVLSGTSRLSLQTQKYASSCNA